jgi:hypothetical protein
MEALRQEFRMRRVNRTLEPISAIALGAAHSSGRRKVVVQDCTQLYHVAVGLGEQMFDMCRHREEWQTEISVPGIYSRMILKFSPHNLTRNLTDLSQEFGIGWNCNGNVTL